MTWRRLSSAMVGFECCVMVCVRMCERMCVTKRRLH